MKTNNSTKNATRLEPSKTKSNTQHAVEVLKNMILENELASGSNHLEGELAALLGMSRTPIREATLILEAQGLVEVKPRHGVRIISLSPEDMVEIYDILTELESLSAALAAEKNLPNSEFKIAERAIKDMDAALERDDRVAWTAADDIFHAELVRLGGNNRIANIIGMYNDQVRRARLLTLNLRPKPIKSNEDHRSVLDAIKQGDSLKARQLHTEHRVQAKNMIVGILQKFGFHKI